jgi:hypothetical protein
MSFKDYIAKVKENKKKKVIKYDLPAATKKPVEKVAYFQNGKQVS